MNHQLEINGRTVSYLDEGSGPVLLFGHSYLWTPEMWRAQIDALSSDFRCIAPALWGHGDCDTVDTEVFTVEGLTDDMEGFVDGLGLADFSLIGLSVGGMWAARLAHRLPERVRNLVLMDTDLGSEPEESRQRFLGMIEMAAQAGSFPPPLAEACLPFFFSDQSLAGPERFVSGFRDSLLAWNPENIAGVCALGRGIFTRPDFLSQLAEVQCSALVLVGEQDRSRPPAEAEVLARTLPNARLEIIPGAGHIPAVEQPEAVNHALIEFLRPA